jgi:diguanylate cyclase (GGDEF)-like protein/PAS domain S-box-containing protein
VSSIPRTVLLADSDPEYALVLQKALQTGGLSADISTDGIDALGKMYSSVPDLLVCGLYLPGLDGLRVCRYLRNDPDLAAVPVILLIPRLERDLLRKARRAGADLVLEIPVNPAELAERCGELIARSAMRPRPPSVSVPPDRASILEDLLSVFERRLNRLEAMKDLSVELAESSSAREICRALAAGVVAGLGFDRVQVFRHHPERGELILETGLGRGLPPEQGIVINLREHDELPAAVAIRERRQVASSSLGIPELRLVWAGSSEYVDTPLVEGERVLGLVRCDCHTSGRSIANEDRESLRELCMMASVALAGALDFEEIGESREQTAAILSSLDSAVVVVDSSLRVVEVTSRARDIFGIQPDASKGRMLAEVLPIMMRDPRPELLRKVFLEGRSGLEQGVSLQAGPGPSLLANLRYVPFRRGGQISGAVILATDVTEEYTLKEDLRRRNEELETLSRIGREMNSSLNLEEISKHLLRALQEFYPEDAISVLLPSDATEDAIPEMLVVFAQTGFPEDTGGYETRRALLFGPARQGEDGAEGRHRTAQGIVPGAFLSKKTMNIPDVSVDNRYVPNLPDTRSELAVPLVVLERAIGVIDLQSNRRNHYNSDSVRRVGTLANHAATAIENARLHARVWEMAQRDRLTGLRNMRFFESKLKEELERSDRYHFECSLVMIDIDDFKRYNDSFGHPMGNLLLRTVSRAIQAVMRDQVDTLARYGGEEFVCILPFVGGRVAAEIAERIRQSVLDSNSDIPHAAEQPLGCVSVSLGVSCFPSDVPDRDKLLEVADQRLYMAKKAGKNRVFSPALGNCPPIRR